MFILFREAPNIGRDLLGEDYMVLVYKAIGWAIAWDCTTLPTFVKVCDGYYRNL